MQLSNTCSKVVITVGSLSQKHLCENFILQLGLPSNNIIVICDDDFGGRIGSGGAVTRVIERFYEPGDKLLIINSGGFSKRNINYAVKGKLFADFFIGNEEKNFVEMLISNGENLFSLIKSGVIVCCSDILVDTTNFKDQLKNNAGFCVKTDFETASRHGVMFFDEKGYLDIYPHKVDCEKLSKLSLQYGVDGAFVDTGLVYFTNEVCQRIKVFAKDECINRYLVENKVDLNLYSDIVSLFAKKVDREEYLSVSDNKAHRKIKEVLFDLLSGFLLDVLPLEGQKFVHIGSVREALTNIVNLADKDKDFITINSIIDKKTSVGKKSVLDNAVVQNCIIGENCFISDITLENVKIESNTSVCGIKQKDGSFVSVVVSIDENPKVRIKGTELWDIQRFYKGKSFSDSFMKFICLADEEKISMAGCTENADADYYVSRQKYLKDRISSCQNEKYIQIRENIIENYFSKNKERKEVSCVKEKVEVVLPVRVNLSGTWTDAMPYSIFHGGEVLNMAVTVDGKKPIKIVAEKIQENRIVFCSDGVEIDFDFSELEEGEELSDFNLHRAVLSVLGIAKETKFYDGIRLETNVSLIDKGSGLGTSSILLAGCFKALGEILGSEFSDDEIYEKVFVAEQVMKTGGGWQDQTGGIVGGMKIISSEAGTEQKLSVKKIVLSPRFEKFISEKMILIPTGQRHFGRFIVSDVAKRFLEKDPETMEGFEKIKKLNNDFLKSIAEENFLEFANSINRHFRILRKISPAVSNQKIDKLSASLLVEYVDAVSVCGAGGGGYLLAVLKDGINLFDVQNFIKDNFGYVSVEVKSIEISY